MSSRGKRSGSAFVSKGDYNQAIANYDEAIRLDPKNVIAYVNLASLWEHKGDSKRALEVRKKAIEAGRYGDAERLVVPHKIQIDCVKNLAERITLKQ
jgi:tetratricopeptide (TPR) repeat protein